MDFNKIFQRVKNILISPAKEWEVIKGEAATTPDLFTKYAIILAAIPAVASFIGWAVIGVTVSAFGFSSTVRVPLGRALFWAIIYYVLTLVSAGALGFLTDALATSFGATKDMVASMKCGVYSMTPAWVGGIFYLIPAIRVFALIAGLYAIYQLYIALLQVKSTPKDKVVGYLVVLIVGVVLLMILTSWLANSIAFGASAPIGMF